MGGKAALDGGEWERDTHRVPGTECLIKLQTRSCLGLLTKGFYIKIVVHLYCRWTGQWQQRTSVVSLFSQAKEVPVTT